MSSNEAITESRLAPRDIRTGGVSAILDEGMRAVAVPGNRVAGISGFIQPGNRVDVLVTMTDPGTQQDVTKLILENVPVLATGTQIQHNAGGEPAPVDVYTLKVSPQDSEKLTLAASRGNIQLALRNILDMESVLTPGARADNTLTSLRVSEANPTQNPTVGPRVPQLPSYSVEVINGDTRDIKRFQGQ